MSEVKNEIRASTLKLEKDLRDKEEEIQRLRDQLVVQGLSVSAPTTIPVTSQPPRWTPKTITTRRKKSRSNVKLCSSIPKMTSHKNRIVGDSILQETDV